MRTKAKKVSATAKCDCFDIDVSVDLRTRGLVDDEAEEVRRRLRDGLTKLIAGLPFARVYPFEVRTK